MNLAALTELRRLAENAGWHALDCYDPSTDGNHMWLNLTHNGTHLDIEWEPGLPTGCQIHASHMTGPRIIVNARSLNLIRQAITDPDWVTHAITLHDSGEPIIDLRDEAA